jgi:hypothetical protein
MSDQRQEGRAVVRRGIYNGMLAMGIPAGRADEIVDLAMHATEEALETVMRVAERASDASQTMTIMHIAYQLLAHEAEQSAKIAIEEARKIGVQESSFIIADHAR